MGPKKDRPKSKIHKDWHHVFPTSRFKIKKSIIQHRAWHMLFSDLTSVEAIWEIKNKWATGSGKINFNRMTDEEKESWSAIFYNKETMAEIIDLINREWSIPGVKIVFEPGSVKQKTKGLVS